MISDQSGLGSIWHLKQSQLYALLAKLEKDGYVTSTLQSQDPHPPRRVFRLTRLGDKAFCEWFTNPVEVPRLIRQVFLAKLYFAQKEDINLAQQLLEKQRVICKKWMDEFKLQLSISEPLSYRWNTYQYRLGHIQALQNWLELCAQNMTRSIVSGPASTRF
jgi:DNA-binding PadR family transcriptional regulator